MGSTELDARPPGEARDVSLQILTWVDFAGYPVSVVVEARIDPATQTAAFEAPAGLSSRPIAKCR